MSGPPGQSHLHHGHPQKHPDPLSGSRVRGGRPWAPDQTRAARSACRPGAAFFGYFLCRSKESITPSRAGPAPKTTRRRAHKTFNKSLPVITAYVLAKVDMRRNSRCSLTPYKCAIRGTSVASLGLAPLLGGLTGDWGVFANVCNTDAYAAQPVPLAAPSIAEDRGVSARTV